MYTLIRRNTSRHVILESNAFNYGQQVWSLCQTRKKFRCCNCGLGKYPPTWAYRPVTKGSNVADRVCRECVDKLTPNTTLPIGKK